jgi:hypothetical protein
MNRIIFAIICLPVLICSAVAQTVDSPNEGTRLTYDRTTSTWTISWWGHAGMGYFIQHSDDLYTWHYLPIVEMGADGIIAWGFTSTDQTLFLRLELTADPYGLDRDGDGMSDGSEVTTSGGDPLKKDHPAVGLSVSGFTAP